MDEHIVVGLVNSISGFIFILFSIPFIMRKIKMNDVYGFRFSKAFESEENWYDINEYGAKKMLGWSIFTLLSGLIAFFINFDEKSILPMLWVGIPITLTTVVPIVQTIYHSKRL